MVNGKWLMVFSIYNLPFTIHDIFFKVASATPEFFYIKR